MNITPRFGSLCFGSRTVGLAIVVAIAILVGACSDNPVGRKCDLGQTPGMSEVVVGSPSLDCPSRQCLKIPVANGKDPPEGFEALAPDIGMCTATCDGDSDCDQVPESPCVSGFTCGIPLTVGPFCCRKLCICKDYVILPDSGKLPTPTACDPAIEANVCCNLDGRVGVYPNCPG